MADLNNVITAYLEIEEIPGESQKVDHEDQIDIHNFEWGMEQASVANVGRGRSSSRATVEPLKVFKYYDKASPFLALGCMQGKSFANAVLYVRRDSGDAHLDYLTITMENVVISAYEVLGATDETRLIEECASLSFDHVKILHVEQADDGSAGGETEMEFDIASGA